MIPAADDYDEIRANLARIRAEEVPRCPTVTSRSLHDCLRNVARCPSDCPHHDDWIGPQPE